MHTWQTSLTETHVSSKLNRLIFEFQSLLEPIDRVKRLLHYATLLPELDPSAKVDLNQVMDCRARVWIQAELGNNGNMRFFTNSNFEIN
ncbi:hypothetical protein SO802_001087 [Lithocarpus litseifolius]|uniref:Fe-S metabolism associated domain-containing protein n=1 Tax=Lithocarpus litseifolius TaxID=425828 RepID=A0AAW2DWR7_9ROSI